ncbi:MAG: DNA primase small subunit PriS [Methanoregulaceae archaeon]
MKPATLEFLRQRFGEYYRTNILSVPPSLLEREWGFLFFDPSPKIQMRRHIAFSEKEEVFNYLRSLVPAHVYYSSAYYATPGAPTMAEKHWTGADLIFDLDADHIVRGPYGVMLARVKQETGKLIGMLTGELGFDPKAIDLVFSGGRGYHIHIRDIAVRGWGSAERRELIDYVCGIGIDPTVVLKAPEGRKEMQGWRKRYVAALVGYLRDIQALPEEEAVQRISDLEGVGKETAKGFVREISSHIELIEQRPDPALMKNRVIRAAVSVKDGDFAARLRETAALADEPVTTDIKRLIRMPTSLHGGSGMRVQPIALSALSDFDPLIDAVVFGDRPVRIESSMSIDMPMLGNSYHIEKGINTVPEALAVFLCCRGAGEIAGG